MVNKSKYLGINRINQFLWLLILLVFGFELVRDSSRDGDFMGYINAGNAVLNGTPIYADFQNTWPPFFAIFSVPLSIVHNFNPVLIRVIWLLGIAFAWYGIMFISAKLFLQQKLVLKNQNGNELNITNWKILLPFIFVLRFVIDDLSNIQINSYLLLACLFILHEIEAKRTLPAAILMGLIVSLKVYPIFLLFFLIWKRHWKFAISAVIAIIVWNSISYAVFGSSLASEYYREWVETRLSGPIIIHHKNQSLFGLMAGLLSDVSRGFEIRYSLLFLDPSVAKKLTMLVILIISAFPAYVMRTSHQLTPLFLRAHEYAIVLAAIPLFSPLAWKYYFVFLFPLYLTVFAQLKQENYSKKWWIVLFTSLALTILSTDGIIGNYFSDVLEIFGCVTIGSAILIVLGFMMYLSKNRAYYKVNSSAYFTSKL